MGSSWFGSSWFGSSWFGSSWSGSSGGSPGFDVFVTRDDHPLAETPVPLHSAAKFRDRDWGAEWISMTILPQFMAAKINGQTWDQAIVLPAPLVVTQQMIDELLVLAVTERPQALPEIIQENQNFQLCWMQLLNITPNSHPETFLLMKLAARVGELSMTILKRRNPNAGRPSQYCPMLYPPVAVPGHSTYPAGHSIIGQLTTECLAELVPQHTVALNKLAARCSINRVIAGLHFRQDCDVGTDVARKLLPFIKQCPVYQATFTAAQAEWDPTTTN